MDPVAYHAEIMLSKQIGIYAVLVDRRVPIKEGPCVCETICVDTNMAIKEVGTPAKNEKIREKIMKNST